MLLAKALSWATLIAPAVASKKPNVLFILTDDQDWHMESIEHMPLLHKYVINEGTTFNNHHCTVAICCPSRVNIWTGRAAHNTNVTDIFPPYGGFPKIVQEGINDNYLPVWMQEAGYNTYYTGKLWNAHSVDNWNNPYAHGFNGSDFLLDPYTYEYYNAHMTRNGAPPVSYAGQYSPDVVAEKAYAFLHEATTHDEPWMLTVAPIAPHSDVRLSLGDYDRFGTDSPKYAPRHAHLFKDYKIPRTENFNPKEHGGVAWMKNLPLLNDTILEYNDEFQRSRLRSLQSVDEMIANLVQILEHKGLLDNTYIFYTTDNGYHISQHRLHPGKECGLDTDIHVPFIVRGPGIPAGHISERVTSHTDISPTVFNLTGNTEDDFDGSIIPLHDVKGIDDSTSEHVNIEFWGKAIPEGIWGQYGNVWDPDVGSKVLTTNNTYKGLRLIAPDYSLYYSVWCSGDKQYYDVKRDPGQIYNYFTNAKPASNYAIAGRSFESILDRLDALMMVLKSCKARQCTHPWEVLHPAGNVRTLTDALSEEFDSFYKHQPKVSFNSCQLGYLTREEGPQNVNAFGEKEAKKGRLPNHRGKGKESAPGLRVQESFQYRGPFSVWT